MPDFEASSGSAAIVATGTVICYRHNPIVVKIGRGVLGSAINSPTAGIELTITFQFVDNQPYRYPNPRWESKGIGPNSLLFILYNYDNPLGIGTTEPLRIATYDNTPFLLSFRVYALAGGDKTLVFTIYKDPRTPLG